MGWIYGLIGLGVGILVGFMGVGGGVILIPALVYGMHMQQHVAQGTSLFLQLPPLGLGALLVYWRTGKVDWVAGIVCAVGILLGGYFGSELAIGLSGRSLNGCFGVFLILAAILLWRKSNPRQAAAKAAE